MCRFVIKLSFESTKKRAKIINKGMKINIVFAMTNVEIEFPISFQLPESRTPKKNRIAMTSYIAMISRNKEFECVFVTCDTSVYATEAKIVGINTFKSKSVPITNGENIVTKRYVLDNSKEDNDATLPVPKKDVSVL